ncbi:MAG: nucleotide exchange factor GrpE [Lachnospiraceae bacterium]|nr:nucleotide exchange factor GrpE [Lachnospiraceae bacterium]
MIFGNKNNSRKTAQMKSVMQEVMTEAFQRQTQELSRMQEEQRNHFNEQIEKNYKAVRGLSDSVEDFLDSLQEEGDGQQQFQQMQEAAQKREQALLALVQLYQQQMELFEQWITGQEHETGEAAREAWQQQYSMLKGKIQAESMLCAIELTGVSGEPVDYRLHEVLQAVEPNNREQEGKIEKVYSQGMLYHGAVIRKARVTAYRKS